MLSVEALLHCLKLFYLLFKTLYFVVLAKWWHTFICISPALWTNQCWRECSLITRQGSWARVHLTLQRPHARRTARHGPRLVGWHGASQSALRVTAWHTTF